MPAQSLPEPALTDVLDAARRIRPHLQATPLRRAPGLDEPAGAEVWLKHELHLPTGAFKVRGGINLVSRLSDEERRAGVITASTGNHGQSIAYAARLFGVRAIICAPEGANPGKVRAMRELGADLILEGRDFDDARLRCEALAAAHGYRYIHSGDEPHLIAGVATATLEMLAEQPELDAIVVPVGGGSGAAGACIVAKAVNPRILVIGVQSEAAPAAYRSWEAGRLLEAPNTTWAEGLATRTAFALPQAIMRRLLDDFVLVSEEDLRDSVRSLVERARVVVEGAGAAALAGALKLRHKLAGKRLALVLSGGNITPAQLAGIFREA